MQWLTELSRSFAARQRVSVLATAHNTRAGRGAQVPICNTEQLCARRRHRLSLDADPCALHRPRKVPPRGAVPAFLGRLRNSHSDCGPEKPKFLNLTQPSHESEPTGAARETGRAGRGKGAGEGETSGASKWPSLLLMRILSQDSRVRKCDYYMENLHTKYEKSCFL